MAWVSWCLNFWRRASGAPTVFLAWKLLRRLLQSNSEERQTTEIVRKALTAVQGTTAAGGVATVPGAASGAGVTLLHTLQAPKLYKTRGHDQTNWVEKSCSWPAQRFRPVMPIMAVQNNFMIFQILSCRHGHAMASSLQP